jgi:hypothetical protein
MVVLDQTSDLWCDFLPFPSHHEKLAHGPNFGISKAMPRFPLDAFLPVQVVPYRIQLIWVLRHVREFVC